MIRTVETHAYCLWRAAVALRQPVLEADQRDEAKQLLWSIARFGATPRLKLKATDALRRAGVVVGHRPVMGGPDAA